MSNTRNTRKPAALATSRRKKKVKPAKIRKARGRLDAATLTFEIPRPMINEAVAEVIANWLINEAPLAVTLGVLRRLALATIEKGASDD